MARGNRTGPWGQGSQTGRGLGFCSGHDSPGFTDESRPGRGRGFSLRHRRERGSGRGYRSWQIIPDVFGDWFSDQAPGNKNDEIDLLKRQAEYLKQAQERLKNRLEKLGE